jgi:hypothetical protein
MMEKEGIPMSSHRPRQLPTVFVAIVLPALNHFLKRPQLLTRL